MSIEETNSIDLVAFSPDEGVVSLVMVEARPWAGNEQLFELQEKLNSYVSFVQSGSLAKAYPALSAKPIRIELRCAAPPSDPNSLGFLAQVRTALASEGLDFAVTPISARSLG